MSANDKADAAWDDYINQQQEEEIQQLQDRIKHLEAALRRIANTDYRGNRSTESQIAFEALKP